MSQTAGASARIWRVAVNVMPRQVLHDPQGVAIQEALAALGFTSVLSLRAGQRLVLELSASDEAAALAQVEAMCQQLLINPILHEYTLDPLGAIAEVGAPS